MIKLQIPDRRQEMRGYERMVAIGLENMLSVK